MQTAGSIPVKQAKHISLTHGLSVRDSEDTLSRLHNCMGGGFIVNVFGTRVGAALPPKFIYSFEFRGQNVQRLSPEENRANNCVDSYTGRALEPEPGCFYC